MASSVSSCSEGARRAEVGRRFSFEARAALPKQGEGAARQPATAAHDAKCRVKPGYRQAANAGPLPPNREADSSAGSARDRKAQLPAQVAAQRCS